MTTGIIPAYAGNTHGHIIGGVNRGDHPRVCGEHHGAFVQLLFAVGIIPAYAGNTSPP